MYWFWILHWLYMVSLCFANYWTDLQVQFFFFMPVLERNQIKINKKIKSLLYTFVKYKWKAILRVLKWCLIWAYWSLLILESCAGKPQYSTAQIYSIHVKLSTEVMVCLWHNLFLRSASLWAHVESSIVAENHSQMQKSSIRMNQARKTTVLEVCQNLASGSNSKYTVQDD